MASEFLVSVRWNMACWRAIVKSTRMQVLVSRSRASVGGRRCTWVPSRDGNGGQRQGKAFRCSLCKKSTWHSYLQHLLSRELQQMRQCKYWCLAASGGWFAISGGCTISAGDTGRAQE